MDVSSVTEKGQATIPAPIRKHLNLKKGDKVAFSLEKNKVIITKVNPVDAAYLQSMNTLLAEEWLSKEDGDAYDGL